MDEDTVINGVAHELWATAQSPEPIEDFIILAMVELQALADTIRADQREKDAALCEAQALEPECPERAAYCAAAIRSAK